MAWLPCNNNKNVLNILNGKTKKESWLIAYKTGGTNGFYIKNGNTGNSMSSTGPWILDYLRIDYSNNVYTVKVLQNCVIIAVVEENVEIDEFHVNDTFSFTRTSNFKDSEFIVFA